MFWSISNMCCHGFFRVSHVFRPEWCVSVTLSLQSVSCGREPRGLQRIFNERFALYSCRFVLKGTFRAFVQSASESCHCHLSTFVKFPPGCCWYNFSSFSREVCLTFSSDLVCWRHLLSPLSSPYSQNTTLQSVRSIFLPGGGFFGWCCGSF